MVFAEGSQEVYFSSAAGRSNDTAKESQLQARLSGDMHKETEMADVKAPQQLDPQDMLKLLVALRRALKNRAA